MTQRLVVVYFFSAATKLSIFNLTC